MIPPVVVEPDEAPDGRFQVLHHLVGHLVNVVFQGPVIVLQLAVGLRMEVKTTSAGKSWGSWWMIAIYRVAKTLYENQAVRSVSVWPRRATSIEDIKAAVMSSNCLSFWLSSVVIKHPSGWVELRVL